jgi:hypothetical protein
VPQVLSGAATHAVVITGVKIDNSSLVNRMWRGQGPAIAFDKLDLIVECLRVVTHLSTGYAQVFLRPLGWADRWTYALPAVADVGTFRRYPAFFDDYGWLKRFPHVATEALAALPEIVKSAATATRTTRLALRRLSLADLRDEDDDKTVDACIGIEALLSNDSIEVTHKIAIRGAVALTTRSADAIEAQTAFSMLKHVYGRRSAIVHGTGKVTKATFDLNDTRIRTSELAVFLLRRLLLSQLTTNPPWSIKDLDDELLQSLSRGSDPEAENSPEKEEGSKESGPKPQSDA